MRILAYTTRENSKGVKVEESTGEGIVSGDGKAILEWLMSEHLGDVGDNPKLANNTVRVCWSLDDTMAPILKLLGRQACEILYETKKCYLAPYSLFYIPGKLFALRDIRVSYGKLELFDLEQYFPAEPYQDDAGEIWNYGMLLYKSLNKMGFYPQRLVSPVKVFEEWVLDHCDLPTGWDMPKEAAEFAWMCSGRLWIECHRMGLFKDAYDYDMVSAFPKVATKLSDTRECNWVGSGEYQPKAVYGYCKGQVTIYDKVMVSPIIYIGENGDSISPVGTWETYLTKAEIDFISKWKIGKFKIEKGYWAVPKNSGRKLPQPLEHIIDRLLEWKKIGGLEGDLAKRMCFSEDTKIMTQNGAKLIPEIKLGELVYSINPLTLQIELKPIVGIKKYPYNGGLIHFENQRHDLLVTTEHRMLLKRDIGRKYEFWEAGQLTSKTINRWYFPPFSVIRGQRQVTFSLWGYVDNEAIVHIKPKKKWSSAFEKDKRFRCIGHSGGYHTIARNITAPEVLEREKDCQVLIKNARRSHSLPWEFAIDDWLELLGWYLSEGNLEFNEKRHSKGIGITNKDHTEGICRLLKRMQLPFGLCNNRNISRIKIMHHAIFNYCVSNCGTHAGAKSIPGEVFSLDYTHLQHLWNTLMAGDGSFAKKGRMAKYSTKSGTLAQDFQRLCLHLGYKTRVVFENGKCPMFRVFIYSKKYQSTLKRKNIKNKQYKGYVWGITVRDNFTVLAGRNNKFEFVGQSVGIYGKLGEEHETEFGKHFSPCWFAEISTQTRLAVAEWLYKHGIGPEDNEGYRSLIHISVDGVLLDKNV